MDRPVSESKQRKKATLKWLRYMLFITLFVIGFLLIRRFLQTKVDRSDFQVAKVEMGDVENAISAYGSVVPAFEQQINAPIATEIKEVLVRSGAAVEKDVLLMQTLQLVI